MLAAAGAGLALPQDTSAAGAPDLVLVKGAPGPATRLAVEKLGGMAAFVKPGQQVVIKPNISFANGPGSGTNTHPDVVRELALLCREAGAKRILVLDHPFRNVDICLDQSGIRPACKDIPEVSVQGLVDAAFYADCDFPQAKSMKKNQVMKDVLAADVLIAAPVAKSHADTGVSLSMKGMMGLVWDRPVMHRDHPLDQAIVDLNTRVKAHLTVIDGTFVLSTNGPAGPGTVNRCDTIIASADPVAADAMAVVEFQWWGRQMRPDQVGHIRLAHEQGLGRMDVQRQRLERLTVG